jgi:hypothetical protein
MRNLQIRSEEDIAEDARALAVLPVDSKEEPLDPDVSRELEQVEDPRTCLWLYAAWPTVSFVGEGLN